MIDKDTNVFDSEWVRTVGYSSMREFIKLIKRENKILKKLGMEVSWVIRLPIK